MICVPKEFFGSPTDICSCEVSQFMLHDSADRTSCEFSGSTYVLVGVWAFIGLAALIIMCWMLFVAYCGRSWRILHKFPNLAASLGVACLTSAFIFLDRVVWIRVLLNNNSTATKSEGLFALSVYVPMAFGLVLSYILTCRVMCLEIARVKMCSSKVVKSQGIQLTIATVLMLAGITLDLIPSPHLDTTQIIILPMIIFTWTSFRRIERHLNYDQQSLFFFSFGQATSFRTISDLRKSARIILVALFVYSVGCVLEIVNVTYIRGVGSSFQISVLYLSTSLLQQIAIIVGMIAIARALYGIAYTMIEKASKIQTMAIAARVPSTASSAPPSPRDRASTEIFIRSLTILESHAEEIQPSDFNSFASMPSISDSLTESSRSSIVV
jgi:hypothetical protein